MNLVPTTANEKIGDWILSLLIDLSNFYLFARVGDKPALRPLQFDVAQPNLRAKIEKSVETALLNCPQTKSAYQVLKKEIEKQKNLFFGVKFEKIPRILSVANDYAFDF